MPQTTTQVMFMLEHLGSLGKDSKRGMFYQLSIHYFTRLCKERYFLVMERGWQGRERKAKRGKWRKYNQKFKINHQVSNKGLRLKEKMNGERRDKNSIQK